MTAKQRREHKRGNQLRKRKLEIKIKRASKQEKGYWAQFGLCQDGKFTLPRYA